MNPWFAIGLFPILVLADVLADCVEDCMASCASTLTTLTVFVPAIRVPAVAEIFFTVGLGSARNDLAERSHFRLSSSSTFISNQSNESN